MKDIAQIDQASTHWTLAQLFDMLVDDMTKEQIQQAKRIMKNNLENHNDWIVLIQSMETLTKWAFRDAELELWLKPHLKRLTVDKRKSVSKRAGKLIERIENNSL